MRMLIIEGDAAIAQSVELLMKSEGFNVYTTDLGEEGVDLAKIYDYDIITLDLNLPDINGLEVLRQIRVAKVNTPIMIVSGASDIETKVKAFGLGADDYLTKSVHRDELVARVHAVVRRAKGHADAIITTGDIEVNLDAKTVTVAGKPVHLTGKEYQMLELLSLRKGGTLTKEMFLSHLYGGMDEPEIKIVDVFMCKLRRKLCEAGRHIETVWGRGYRLCDEPTRPHRPATKRQTTINVSIIEALTQAWPGSLMKRDIMSATGIQQTSVAPALTRLKRDRKIDRLGSSSVGFVYRLAEAPKASAQNQAA